MSQSLRHQDNSMDVELPHAGKEVICAVAQPPSQKDDSFLCTLRPIMFADSCRPASGDEFPDRGLVWWWWKAGVNEPNLPLPGKMFSVILEPAREQAQGKDHYQVRRGSAKELHQAGFYELLRAESREFRSESDLISKPFILGHIPSSIVFVIWNDQLLGPFRTTAAEAKSGSLSWNVSLSTQKTGNSVNRILHAKSAAYRKLGWQTLSIRYSTSGRVTGDQDLSQSSQCLLLKKDQLDEDLRDAETFRLETDSELIRRIADEALSLTRKERKELREFLVQLETRLSNAESQECPLALKAIERVREIEHVDQETVDLAVKALLDCGALTEQIKCCIEEKALQEAVQIRKQAEDQCGELNKALNQLREDCEEKRAEIELMENEFTSASIRRNQVIEKRKLELEEKEAAFLAVLLPVSEEIKSGGTGLLQQALKFRCMFPELGGPSLQPVTFQRPVSPNSLSAVQTGAGFANPSEFLKQRLHPMLKEWNPKISDAEAKNLLASFLGSRCILLPEIYPASVMAESVGTSLDLYHVEPDWLSFRPLWDGGLRQTWQDACNNADQIFIVAVSGINRAPSGAWAQPILTHCASLSRRMPDLGQTAWPENLRIAFVWDPPNDVTFELDMSFRLGCSAWTAVGMNSDGQKLTTINGFVSAEIWREWSEVSEKGGCNLELLTDERTFSPTWSRGAASDIKRMAGALISCGVDDSSAIKVATFLRRRAPAEAAVLNEQ